MTSYGTASYSYGANGELRTKVVGTDTTKYTYDALGNLTRVVLPNGTDIDYVIDAQNRRIGKKVNGVLVQGFLYQGQLTPVAELDGTGNVTARFVYATGINVPDYVVKGDSTYRLIRDHLGSVRLVVNVLSGTIAQRIDYDEFGVETQNTNPGFQPFGYAGGLTEAQTGLVRFGARDYLPEAGRWTAKDPIGFGGDEGNFYAYSTQDPLNRRDPTGKKTYVLIFRGLGPVGGHAAVFVQNNGHPVLYDPSGDYRPSWYTKENWRPSGDAWYDEEALLSDYLQYQRARGETIDMFVADTDAEAESAIANRIMEEDNPGWAECAAFVSAVLSGIGPFPEMSTRFPGRIRWQLSGRDGIKKHTVHPFPAP